MAERTNQKPESARRWTGVVGPWAFCLLSPAFCFLPAGCAPDDFGVNNDPLFGSTPPPVRPPGGAVSGPIQPVAGTVPPLPPSAPSGTPAALAGAARGPLDPTRDLRIGSDTGAPTWQASGGPAVALQAPQPGGGGAVPLQPRPVTDGQLTGHVTPPTPAPTYEQLKAQLLQRGVTQISIKADYRTGKIVMTAFAQSKADPNKQKRYDVAPAADEVSAMQALLENIDQGQ
jgi:hypothetical protein